MRIPETPPELHDLFAKTDAQRLGKLLLKGVKAEIDGRYLHWDELRHRSPPSGFTHPEWWLGIAFIRNSLKVPLPFRGMDGRPFQFARADAAQRLLHQIDRDF